MAAINENAVPKFPGKLYVALWNSSIPTVLDDSSNADAVAAYIDANLSFQRLANITDAQVARDQSAEIVEVETDDEGTLYKATREEIRCTGNWYEVGEVEAIKILTGDSELILAGTPIPGAVQTVLDGSWSFNTAFKVENANGDGTKVTVNSVTGSVDGALVEDTDFFVGLDENGFTTITIIDSATVTTEAQDITINYDYTPSATKYTSTTIKARELQKLVVRIDVLNTDTGKTNQHYLINAGLEGQLVEAFVDVVRAGDINPSAFDFLTNKGGQYIRKAENF